MALNVFPRKSDSEDTFPAAAVLQRVAFVLFGFGLLVTLVTMRDLSDQNMPLMAGIGFIVGSIQIMLIGAAMQLFQQMKSDS